MARPTIAEIVPGDVVVIRRAGSKGIETIVGQIIRETTAAGGGYVVEYVRRGRTHIGCFGPDCYTTGLACGSMRIIRTYSPTMLASVTPI